MNILITGGAGYIGSHLTHTLITKDHNVIIVDNMENCSKPPLWSDKVENVNVGNYYEMMNLVSNYYNFDAVIHLAADKTDSPNCISNNLNTSTNIFRVCHTAKIPILINTSSASVYGTVDHPVSEWEECRPYNGYGWSKLSSERAIHGMKESLKSKTMVVTLRLFNVVGRAIVPSLDHGWRGKDVLSMWKFRLQKNLHISLNGTQENTPTRDYIYVGDVCDAYMKVLYGYKEINDIRPIFNVGSMKPVSLKNLYDAMCNVLSFEPELVYAGEKDEISFSLADIDNTKKILNWEPKINLEGIVRSSLI